jgi:protein phosphatase
MPLELAGLTDVGRKRAHNEDALLLAPRHGLLVVADGMGGHESGEVASNLCITTLEKFFDSQAADPDLTWPFRFDAAHDLESNRLMVGFRLANKRIRDAGGRMGTTCVAVRVVGPRAWFAWVGDSRGYVYRRGALMPVTSDHSLLNELLTIGRLAPADVPHFQHKNVITRALGMAADVVVDVRPVGLEPDDVVLVCCDGVTGMLDDERLGALLEDERSLDRACQRIVDASNAAGGLDNITVALARWRPD